MDIEKGKYRLTQDKEKSIMGKMKKFMSVTAVTCMALTVLTGCGGQTTGDSNEIKIGLNYEQTGDVSEYGLAELDGSRLAIKLANARTDAKFKYKAVEYNNKSNADESTTIATKLATQDGVAGIVGPATSGASAVTYQVASDNKVPVVSPSATQTNVTLAKATDKSTVYPYAFRVCFEDAYQGAAMATYTFDTLKKTKAVVISDSTNDYAKGLSKAFQDKFKEKGGKIVEEVNYQAKDTEFNSILTKIKGNDFDVIYIPGYYNEVGLIIKQARAMGIKTPIVGGDGFDSANLPDLAGKENLNDVYFTTGYTTVDASEELKSFIAEYKKEFNKEPSMFAALAFDATNTLIQAIETAGEANGEKIQEALTKIDFKGITGSFTFDETHSPKKTALVVRLVDGVQTDAVNVDPNK